MKCETVADRIPQIAADQVQDFVLVSSKEQIERPAVSFLDASDKFFVCILGQYRALWQFNRADILTAVRHLY